MQNIKKSCDELCRWGALDVSMQAYQCNKRNSLVDNADNGIGYVCLGAGGMRKIFVASFPFCYEPKTTWEKTKS
jgi:hypothetical protein